ncbi:MAG TPA: glucosaminidase domain-containing protein [Chitinophagaceae bacterium]|nr:glucosaminidase domain-containing protein [Chitinophagaceae bacterium]
MKCRMNFLLFALFLTVQAFAQSNTDVINEYIDTYRELAIAEMQRTGVPASIKLAQGILETEAGKSDLVMRSNNHFGIKCKSWWTGEKVYHDDDERGECFRKYSSAEDSYKDHSDYLRNTERYASLFRLDPTDYKGWAYGLKSAGYATNPKYPQILIKYIEQYNLNDYTLIALGRKAQESIASSTSEPATTSVKAVNSSMGAEKKKVNYPSGEFRINGTRVVYAKAGTSIKSLADKYILNPQWVLDFNDMETNFTALEEDQLIFLQRKRKQGEKEFYVVEEFDDLYTVSQKVGIRLESLLDYNHLSPDMIPAPGEKLYLQKSSPLRPKLAYVQ